jgi:hypothetical protein
LVKAWSERSWKPLATIGIPSAVAAVFYLVYNFLTFGSWSPLAAYDAVGGLIGNEGTWSWIENAISAFLGPRHGVLIWSAWLTVSLFALASIRSRVPRWLIATPILAGIYIVLHSSLEIASGALFFNYRYPLEAVTVAAPTLMMTFPEFDESRRRRIFMGAAMTLSVFLQACYVFVSICWLDESGVMVCSFWG